MSGHSDPLRGHTTRGGRGRGGFYNNNRGRGRGNRGGFQQHNNYNNNPYRNADVDYSPEAIESRFAAFYLPSMTQDPWQHLIQEQDNK